MHLVVVETFRTTWRHEIVSSQGFSVRLSGRIRTHRANSE